MDMETLEEFVTIYETLSFQETAFRLNISQSALTKHIHKLEEELGVSLFDRSTRSVKPNEFSNAYYPYAQQIVRTSKEAASVMRHLSKNDEATLTLAFTSMCSHYGIIELISEFSEMYPQYQVQLTEEFRVCDMILGNQCDFAFANDAVQIDDRLDKIIYRADHLSLYMHRTDPLAKQKEVPLSLLKDRKFIAHSRANGAYHLDTVNFLSACEKEGFEPNFASSVSYTSTIMKLVKNGQGIAVLYCGQLPEDQKDPDIVSVDLVPTIDSTVYMLYNRKHKPTDARKTFLHFLMSRKEKE